MLGSLRERQIAITGGHETGPTGEVAPRPDEVPSPALPSVRIIHFLEHFPLRISRMRNPSFLIRAIRAIRG
jgi:hypothetical protein